MILTLKDKTIIEVLDKSISTSLFLTVKDEAALTTIRESLTDENLSNFTFGNGETKYGIYTNFTLASVSYTVNEDSTLSVNIILRQLSDIELRLAAIEEGQETQNDAIAEMSEVIYS